MIIEHFDGKSAARGKMQDSPLALVCFPAPRFPDDGAKETEGEKEGRETFSSPAFYEGLFRGAVKSGAPAVLCNLSDRAVAPGNS